jgi:hypothetical protein
MLDQADSIMRELRIGHRPSGDCDKRQWSTSTCTARPREAPAQCTASRRVKVRQSGPNQRKLTVHIPSSKRERWRMVAR